MKRILFVGSEYYPFVKTGGRGDAIASLLRSLQMSGNYPVAGPLGDY